MADKRLIVHSFAGTRVSESDRPPISEIDRAGHAAGIAGQARIDPAADTILAGAAAQKLALGQSRRLRFQRHQERLEAAAFLGVGRRDSRGHSLRVHLRLSTRQSRVPLRID